MLMYVGKILDCATGSWWRALSLGMLSQEWALQGRHRVPDAQDGLPTGLELACQGGHGRSFSQPPHRLLSLLRRQARRPAQALALRLGPAQPRLGALDQEVALELRDCVDDVHGQLAVLSGLAPAQTAVVSEAQRRAVKRLPRCPVRSRFS